MLLPLIDRLAIGCEKVNGMGEMFIVANPPSNHKDWSGDLLHDDAYAPTDKAGFVFSKVSLTSQPITNGRLQKR